MPTSQTASAQPGDELEHLLGPGVGGEVEVVAEAAEQRVAHRAADQRQLVAGRREALAELERRPPRARAARRRRAATSAARSGSAACGRHGGGTSRQPRRRGARLSSGSCPAPRVPRLPRAGGRSTAARAARLAARRGDQRRRASSLDRSDGVRPAPPSSPGTTAAGAWCGRCPRATSRRGETPEQAAVREVEEETGIRGRVLGPSAPSTSGSSPSSAACTRPCTTSCSRPTAASSPTRTSRSSRSPGCRSTEVPARLALRRRAPAARPGARAARRGRRQPRAPPG